ncbi:MAG: UDP-N-acetylmuramoyl-tripeptide--D-alanyl-D-alanine ligase [Candidatus Omnitrophica bacterium]|nr:UDP-N-acetylmuramoyl-tripeptide--D-alanyl-D-alanine ligase [Candidatus Omnitrophota bacterium]
MASFTLQEILDATGGMLLAGKLGQRVSGISTDSRTVKKGQLFLAIKGDTFDGHDSLAAAAKGGASAFVVHRKDVCIPEGKAGILVEDTVKALGHIARDHRQRFNIPIIAITGSAGKTSTKELIASVMRQKYAVLFNKGTENNHIGVPKTLLKLTRRHQVAVIEMGTNHPGEIAWLAQNTLPTVAVFTNVGASHLEGLGSLEGVFEEKLSLLKYLSRDGHAVVNADDPFWSRLLKKRLPQRVVSYGIRCKADVMATDIAPAAAGISFKVDKKFLFAVKSPSLGAVQNALAAIICARIFGLSNPKVQRAVLRSKPAQGRQCLTKVSGITLIDDTYNANPVSYKNAIATLKMLKGRGRSVLIAADMLELGVHSDALHREVGKAVAEAGIDALFTCGQGGALIAEGVKSKSSGTYVCSFSDQPSLVDALKIYLRRGDVVLFKGSRGMRMEKVFADIKIFLRG